MGHFAAIGSFLDPISRGLTERALRDKDLRTGQAIKRVDAAVAERKTRTATERALQDRIASVKAAGLVPQDFDDVDLRDLIRGATFEQASKRLNALRPKPVSKSPTPSTSSGEQTQSLLGGSQSQAQTSTAIQPSPLPELPKDVQSAASVSGVDVSEQERPQQRQQRKPGAQRFESIERDRVASGLGATLSALSNSQITRENAQEFFNAATGMSNFKIPVDILRTGKEIQREKTISAVAAAKEALAFNTQIVASAAEATGTDLPIEAARAVANKNLSLAEVTPLRAPGGGAVPSEFIRTLQQNLASVDTAVATLFEDVNFDQEGGFSFLGDDVVERREAVFRLSQGAKNLITAHTQQMVSIGQVPKLGAEDAVNIVRQAIEAPKIAPIFFEVKEAVAQGKVNIGNAISAGIISKEEGVNLQREHLQSAFVNNELPTTPIETIDIEVGPIIKEQGTKKTPKGEKAVTTERRDTITLPKFDSTGKKFTKLTAKFTMFLLSGRELTANAILQLLEQ